MYIAGLTDLGLAGTWDFCLYTDSKIWTYGALIVGNFTNMI